MVTSHALKGGCASNLNRTLAWTPLPKASPAQTLPCWTSSEGRPRVGARSGASLCHPARSVTPLPGHRVKGWRGRSIVQRLSTEDASDRGETSTAPDGTASRVARGSPIGEQAARCPRRGGASKAYVIGALLTTT